MCVNTVNDQVQCLDYDNILEFSQGADLSISFNSVSGNLTKYKGAYKGVYLFKNVPSTHALGFRIPANLSSDITITGDTYDGSVNVSGQSIPFYYGNVTVEILTNLPTTTLSFGYKSNINSFNFNTLLIHDYCDLNRGLRYYYSSTPLPINCSECNNSILSNLFKNSY